MSAATSGGWSIANIAALIRDYGDYGDYGVSA
jgi:hypothetical protein